jgi:organic hydroperoxide reductase OsmC/OhrA
MARVLYTARTHVTGGREDGHGLSADGEPEVHQMCPYSNATRGNIDVGLLLDGKPI